MKAARILSIILSGFLMYTLFMFGVLSLEEGYNPVMPDIDTYYAKGFNETRFNALKAGMDTNEVLKLLGRPISTQTLPDSAELWYYTNDGKCKWMDFAWIGREIIFKKNGRVREVDKTVHYD